MSKVTTEDIKKLREETGAGIMDAKRALESASKQQTANSKQVFEVAKEIIRKQGIIKADKKADRETGAGYVFSYVHFNGKVGALVKLACETDFVARTDDFQNLGKELAMQVASMGATTPEELQAQDYLRDAKRTIAELVKETSGKTGENINILAIAKL